MLTVRRLLALLTRPERLRLLGLAVVAVFSGILETAGVASILPFLQLVADPAAIEGWPVVPGLAERLGIEGTDQLLMAAGTVLLATIAFSNLASALTVWFTNRFSWSLQHRLSTRLLGGYLRQPYAFYLGRNTADLGKNLLIEVNHVMNSVLQPLLQVAVRSISALLILGLLGLVNWRLSLVCGVVLGGAYAIVYLGLRSSQSRLGEERFAMNADMFRVAQEGLSGIKTVKTLGREDQFLKRFAEPSWGLATRSAKHHTIGRIPRYVLETVTFGGIVFVVLFYLRSGSGLTEALPLLGLYAFAAYRLLPSLNEIFNSLVRVRFNAVALDTLDDEFRQVGGVEAASERPSSQGPASPATLPLQDTLSFQDISLTYEGAHRPALDNVSFSVTRNQIVGFAGATGAGKTTLVDVMLGLLAPNAGTVTIDATALTPENALEWRRACGYVPQDVFLSDQSIAANIAFGIPDSEIDREAVSRAAEAAQLLAFVEELPERFDTIVGERGVRLSGGQRQRIGIARALLHDPDVLIFDEATSALDGVTEGAVLETVLSLAGKKTLVLIAHRLSTLKRCDVIYIMDGGRIVESGTYDELHETSARFRAMASGAPDTSAADVVS